MADSRLVYSTESGRVCPECRKPGLDCTCKKKRAQSTPTTKPDGIVRIRREVKGRKGKTVTTLAGFAAGDPDLGQLAKQLKQLCGTGGSVKDGVIIIQGDHRDTARDFLVERGYETKLAGG